jgi:hypothetical protein
MKHPETHMVTAEHGPRQANPNRCLYCKQPIGSLHLEDCVCRDRTVMVRMTIDICIKACESDTVEDIKFFLNEGSWCSSNIIDDLQRVECICPHTEFEYIGEATEEDEENWNLRIRRECASKGSEMKSESKKRGVTF